MPRQIFHSQKNKNLLQSKSDDYKERLIKMIPADIVAFYLTCNSAVAAYEGSQAAYWSVFFLVLISVPFYLSRIMLVESKRQIVIMCITFVLWCITLDEPFNENLFHGLKPKQLFSSIAVAAFIYIIPMCYKGKSTDTTSTNV